MKGDKIILGITHGDINGISYEVIMKSLRITVYLIYAHRWFMVHQKLPHTTGRP